MDRDNLFNLDFGNNEAGEGGEVKPVKKPRKPIFKINADYLVDNESALKTLYKTLTNEERLKLKGENNEISDLRKVMNLY